MLNTKFIKDVFKCLLRNTISPYFGKQKFVTEYYVKLEYWTYSKYSPRYKYLGCYHMNTSCSDIQLSEHIVCSGKCLSAPMDADKFLQEHTVCANKTEL